MKALAAGEQVKPIRFRDGDFWQELAEDFNAVTRRLQNTDESADSKQLSESEDESLEVSATAD